MAMAMAMAAVLLLFVLAAPAVHSLQYNVTWNLMTNYNSWAAGKTFTVGDTLVFTYTTEHAVDVVDQNEYATCNSWNAFYSYTGGKTAISLATPGPMYFLCPIKGHCQAGMKLGITVMAAAASPATLTTPPPTSPTNPKPPPPTSTTTPTSRPSPSPLVSPLPAVTSPSGSPSSGPSQTTSTTPVTAAAPISPKSSSGAGGMIGNMGSLVAIGFSVVVAGLVGFMG